MRRAVLNALLHRLSIVPRGVKHDARSVDKAQRTIAVGGGFISEIIEITVI